MEICSSFAATNNGSITFIQKGVNSQLLFVHEESHTHLFLVTQLGLLITFERSRNNSSNVISRHA